MVIRTEYRGQRYSMGNSYPLPAGFEIQFGSLNFQDTGNSYLMRITNRAELHPWRSTRPGPVPATPAVGVLPLFRTSTSTPFWLVLTPSASRTTSGRARVSAIKP
jgi:hypothetical protein